MSIEIPLAVCQHCGVMIDAAMQVATGVKERPPSAGDISICMYCKEFNEFTGDPEAPLKAISVKEALSKVTRVGCGVCDFVGATSEDTVMHMAQTGHGVPPDMVEQLRDGNTFGEILEMVEAIRTGELDPRATFSGPFGSEQVTVESWETLRMKGKIH